jgi:hypothetical protein
MRKTEIFILSSEGRETLNLLAGTKGIFVLAYHPYQQPCQSSGTSVPLRHGARTLKQSDPFLNYLKACIVNHSSGCLQQPVSFKMTTQEETITSTYLKACIVNCSSVCSSLLALKMTTQEETIACLHIPTK